AMLIVASSAFHQTGHTGVAELQGAYKTLQPLLGPFAAVVFAVALLASGLSSSAVGTMAGQVIMQGFVGFRIPLWVRRVVTMIPAIIVISLGLNATAMIILSQVVLSIALPAPMLTLVYFTSKERVMGPLLVNRKVTTLAVGVCTMLILSFNVILLAQSL
ncbi:MAG: Nramp family divalent metal transporter, partial [Chloroflexi bacterium]|nr:Nramp family divalent metal transporter [Chloroflexota bacterium]